MSVFEYLGVLLSVILGLGLTHILSGVSKTIHARETMKIYWVHLLWALSVVIYIVVIWWGMFWWSSQESWTFYEFLLLIIYAVFLFMSASLLFPWDMPKDLDLEEHFYKTRPWFFSVMTLTWLLDIPETMLKAQGNLRDVPSLYFFFVAVQLSILVACLVTDNRTWHKIAAVIWPTFIFGFLSVTTLAKIAT